VISLVFDLNKFVLKDQYFSFFEPMAIFYKVGTDTQFTLYLKEMPIHGDAEEGGLSLVYPNPQPFSSTPGKVHHPCNHYIIQ